LLTWSEAFPGKKMPGKTEIERMYRIAYTVDPAIYRIQDVIEFGIDIHRLKEFGEVLMKKDVSKLRKGVRALWDRMDDHQKAAFLVGDVVSSLKNLGKLVADLEKLMGPIMEAHEGLELIQNGLFARIPKALRDRLERGFGKWRTNGG
jgi:hypothetical protein